VQTACVAKRAVTREQESSAPSVAERVDRIVGLMQRGQWLRGRSGPMLAREWGVAVNVVEKASAEASRIVAANLRDPEKLKVDVAVVLMENLHRASDAGQYKAVASLGDVVTRIMGARSPEKHVVEMSEEQARARYKELTGKEWGE